MKPLLPLLILLPLALSNCTSTARSTGETQFIAQAGKPAVRSAAAAVTAKTRAGTTGSPAAPVPASSQPQSPKSTTVAGPAQPLDEQAAVRAVRQRLWHVGVQIYGTENWTHAQLLNLERAVQETREIARQKGLQPDYSKLDLRAIAAAPPLAELPPYNFLASSAPRSRYRSSNSTRSLSGSTVASVPNYSLSNFNGLAYRPGNTASSGSGGRRSTRSTPGYTATYNAPVYYKPAYIPQQPPVSHVTNP